MFGTDYPTPDGTCIRDYIHVSDLVRAHSDALAYLRGGGHRSTLNCGYGHGFSVLDVIDTVKRVSGRRFQSRAWRAAAPVIRRRLVARSDRARSVLGWQPQFDHLANHCRARAGVGTQADGAAEY